MKTICMIIGLATISENTCINVYTIIFCVVLSVIYIVTYFKRSFLPSRSTQPHFKNLSVKDCDFNINRHVCFWNVSFGIYNSCSHSMFSFNIYWSKNWVVKRKNMPVVINCLCLKIKICFNFPTYLSHFLLSLYNYFNKWTSPNKHLR